MNCPKCASPFEEIEIEQVVVHRCTQCYGLWFERGNHEMLKNIKGSEKIDIGDAKSDRDDRATIYCSQCSSPMVRMVVPDQHHIWYESCSSCGGVFFDAGEFRDYKHKSVLDFIRDLFTPERD